MRGYPLFVILRDQIHAQWNVKGIFLVVLIVFSYPASRLGEHLVGCLAWLRALRVLGLIPKDLGLKS